MSFVAEARRLRKALEGAVHETVQADPALKAEHKRLSKSRTSYQEIPGLIVLVVCVCLGLAMSPRPSLALLLVWNVFVTLAVFGHANELLDRLSGARTREAALPFAHADLFDLERRRAARHRWWWLLLFGLVALTLIGLELWASRGAFVWQRALTWGAIACVQALSVHAFALLLVRYLPEAPAAALGGCCCLLFFGAILIAIAFRGEVVSGVLDLVHAHPWVLLLTPLGWAPHGLLAVVEERWVEALWLLPPLAGLAWAAHATSTLATQGWAALPDEDPDLDVPLPAHDEDAQEGVLGEIRSAAWFADWGVEERGGWVERAIVRTLSHRERLVFRYLDRDPQWTLRWYVAMALLLLSLALALIFGEAVVGLHFVLLVLAAMAGFPSPGSDALSGLSMARLSGGWIPRYAFYPLTYRGLTRVLLKVSLIRALTFLFPFVAVLGPIAATLKGWSLAEGWALGGKLALISLGLVPAVAASQIDAEQEGFSFRLRWVPLVILWTALVAAGCLLLFLKPSSAIRLGVGGPEFDAGSVFGALGAALVWGCGWVAWLAGPRLHARRDLLRTKPPEGDDGSE